MANQEQVKRLKQGVEGWNKWRNDNPDISIDLSFANLPRADLRLADLRKAAIMSANLYGANCEKANLGGAYLISTNFREAHFEGADLRGALIVWANFDKAHLDDAKFGGAIMGDTVFVDTDLSKIEGLEDGVKHLFPSIVDTKTFQRSKGKTPIKFLRGCGLSDWEIESTKLYQPELSSKEANDIIHHIYDLLANQAIQINPLFISYSHVDGEFVDEMEKHLDEKGIRFWRDIHDATAGRLEKMVDRAIRQNPIELLILSENSVKSDWVEHEARTARELEKELGREVLCPVALDDAWKDCKWPERLREQIMEYNILDFSKWKDEAEFAKMFRKLVDGLDLFYREG